MHNFQTHFSVAIFSEFTTIRTGSNNQISRYSAKRKSDWYKFISLGAVRSYVEQDNQDSSTTLHLESSENFRSFGFSEELNTRVVAEYSDFGPIERYISETLQDSS